MVFLPITFFCILPGAFYALLLIWKEGNIFPLSNKIKLNQEKTKTVLNFLENLEDDDDVQYVYANIDIGNIHQLLFFHLLYKDS